MRKAMIAVLLVGLLALIASAAFATPGGGPPDGPAGLDRAIEAQERHTNDLMVIQGVVGTAVGLGPGNAPAVFVFTEREGVRGIPSELNGVRVVPHVTGAFETLHHRPGHGGGPGGGGGNGGDDQNEGEEPAPTCSRMEWCEKAPIGVTTGHPDITAGTIGARVRDSSGNVYALSNNHVYANSNNASNGDIVLQPGTFDGGTITNDAHHLGTLYDLEPIDFEGDNIMDAAIALSDTDRLGNRTLPDGYGLPGANPIAPEQLRFNQRVLKYGRTTGQTEGRVWAINATVNVNFGDSGTARFVNQIVITPGNFSAGGDSGSLVVDRGSSRPIGLLFAGSSTSTIVNPIGPILDRFGVSIDTDDD